MTIGYRCCDGDRYVWLRERAMVGIYSTSPQMIRWMVLKNGATAAPLVSFYLLPKQSIRKNAEPSQDQAAELVSCTYILRNWFKICGRFSALVGLCLAGPLILGTYYRIAKQLRQSQCCLFASLYEVDVRLVIIISCCCLPKNLKLI